MIAEYLLMGIIFFLSCYVTKTDYSEGIIPNSVIKKALIIACIIDLFYYTFEGKQYLEAFWANVLIVSGLSFLLFKRHIFAGGDCKLVIVLAMLYPGRFYFTYYGKPYTLIIAVVLSIVYGIIFLFMVSIKDLITGKQHLSKGYVIDYIKKFLFSFVKITVYISVISPFIDFIILEKISMSGIVRIWVLRVIIFCCVILVNKHPIFNNKILFLCVLAGDVLVSLKYHFLPFNGGMKRYLFFTFLIFGQIILKNNVYKEIEISSLKKGMILSMVTSISMQSSHIRNLPGISSEDLSDRLTEEQVASVKRWGKSRKIDYLVIVKKIPFAGFIALGFASYYLIWRILL